MSIYGPIKKEETESVDADLSLYAKKTEVLSKAGGLMRGDINMNQQQIKNLGNPSEAQDCATMGYVSAYATHLQNNKVDWAGGRMMGPLSMGTFKITDVGNPETETDVVNKKYVDDLIVHEHEFNPSVVGRYLVIPEESGEKNYISVRTKKNIDLLTHLQVEIKNDAIVNNSINPQSIQIASDFTLLPNPNKSLGSMRTNSALQIDFAPRLQEPWSLVFSAKPGNLQSDRNRSTLRFINGRDLKLFDIDWSSGDFIYTITGVGSTTINMDTTQFNHVAVEYVGAKLTIWINGKSRKMHNINLGDLAQIRVGIKELGILSFYTRELSKFEVAEHFVEYQVKNFSDDEVLI